MVSLWALIDGYADRQAQRRSGANGSLRMVVRLNLRGARASLILHSFFLLLGLRALAAPPAGGVTVLAIGFIVVAASNVQAVGFNQWERVRMRRTAARSVLP
jgi:hypothetical protein